jgi:mRNA interferase HigB
MKSFMQVISKRVLRDFWAQHHHAQTPLQTWHRVVSKARWAGPADVKAMFGSSVDFVGDNRIIFDIGGNKYRLVAHAAYPFGRVLIKFVGTHKDYDAIDPETV